MLLDRLARACEAESRLILPSKSKSLHSPRPSYPEGLTIFTSLTAQLSYVKADVAIYLYPKRKYCHSEKKVAFAVNAVYTMGMDVSMEKVKAIFDESGMTLQALGEAMGFEPSIARQSAYQFLKSADPRISSLRRFAKAVKVRIEKLVSEKKCLARMR